LGVLCLTLAAGVLHRLGRGAWTAFEADVLFWGLVLTWPVFVLEGVLRLAVCRRPGMSPWRRVAAFVAVCLFPPLRMGGRAYADAEKIWLPGLGWSHVDHHLRNRLERFFSVPMIVVALMVVPFLAMEYFWLERVRADFVLSLVLDIGTSVIWLAFAVELIVMVSVADGMALYCLYHWIDVAIVFLPLVDFLPILRLLRIAGLFEFEQVGRLGRVYRLRGLISRGWRAILLLEMFHRLLGHYREKRLARLKKLLAAREEELADLRAEVAELEGLLAREKAKGR
jgi:voltage-gated potassium channel